MNEVEATPTGAFPYIYGTAQSDVERAEKVRAIHTGSSLQANPRRLRQLEENGN